MKRWLWAVLLSLAAWSAMGQEEQGDIQVYVFGADGLPLEGVLLELEADSHRSDSNGFIGLRCPPGLRELVFSHNGLPLIKVKALVQSGQVTEVIVNVSGSSGAAAVEGAQTEEAPTDADPSLPRGILSGLVLDIQTRQPLAGVTIIFRGIAAETRTGEDGRFRVELPEGSWSFSAIHPRFSSQTVDGVRILSGQSAELTLELTPSAIELEEVPVYASVTVRIQGGIAAMVEELRDSAVMLNLIGSEQITRAGDSDAASALRRVTGLSVVDGKFVYVRGMGERYSSSYLGDSLLPSPEIDKRVVPFDLFPTSVIESLAIQKTYSPNLLGDFGGGAVRLRTLGIPEERIARKAWTTINASLGFNSGVTFTEKLMESRSWTDWLGGDFGERALPEEIAAYDRLVEDPFGGGLTRADINALGRRMPNDWSPKAMVVPFDVSLSASVKDKAELGGKRFFGYNLSALYRSSFDSLQEDLTSYSFTPGKKPAILTDYRSEVNSQTVDLGGLLNLAYQRGEELNLEASTLLIRTSTGEMNRYSGLYTDNLSDIQVSALSWVEQMLFNQKLGGQVSLGILNQADLDWQYSYSFANRYEPSHRTTRFDDGVADNDFQEGTAVLSDRPESFKRVYTDVSDHIHDGTLKLSIPVYWLSSGAADFLQTGLQAIWRARSTDTRKFWYPIQTGLPPALQDYQDPEDIFADPGFGAHSDFLETTLATDNYTARQLLLGGFLSGDFQLATRLRATGGARLEYSDQTVNTFDVNSGAPLSAPLRTVDLLPALNLTLTLGSKSQLRLAGSRTVNRPDFRELSNAYRDLPVGGGKLIGNPYLKKADIWSADLRWEYFPPEPEKPVQRQSLSVAAFYKHFVNAIEETNLPAATGGVIVTYGNVPRAFNTGAELEWLLYFNGPGNQLRLLANRRGNAFLRALSAVVQDMSASGNLALIFSQIDYAGSGKGVNTTEVRPLQGQSPYVVNVSLGYENSASWHNYHPVHLNLFLNYNVAGRRISRIGTYGEPDYYEEAFHQLDLVVKQRFSRNFSLNFKAKNLLDLPARETVGKVPLREYRKGRSFTLGGTIEF